MSADCHLDYKLSKDLYSGPGNSIISILSKTSSKLVSLQFRKNYKSKSPTYLSYLPQNTTVHGEKHVYKIILYQACPKEEICNITGRTGKIRDIIYKNSVAIQIEKHTTT